MDGMGITSVLHVGVGDLFFSNVFFFPTIIAEAENWRAAVSQKQL